MRVAPAPPAHGAHARSQRGGSANDVRAAAWLSKDVAVAFVQHLSPPYARRVTDRWIMRVDLTNRPRVLARTRVHVRGAVGQPVSRRRLAGRAARLDGLRPQLLAADAAGHVTVVRAGTLVPGPARSSRRAAAGSCCFCPN